MNIIASPRSRRRSAVVAEAAFKIPGAFTEPSFTDPVGRMRAEMFLETPTLQEAPQYHQDIKNPIDLRKIKQKIENNEYTSLSQFSADVHLMFNNARAFNAKDSLIFDDANALENVFDEHLKQADLSWPSIISAAAEIYPRCVQAAFPSRVTDILTKAFQQNRLPDRSVDSRWGRVCPTLSILVKSFAQLDQFRSSQYLHDNHDHRSSDIYPVEGVLGAMNVSDDFRVVDNNGKTTEMPPAPKSGSIHITVNVVPYLTVGSQFEVRIDGTEVIHDCIA